MPLSRNEIIEQAFLAAAACADSAEQEKVIWSKCDGDAALIAEVRSLLGGHEAAGGVLDRRSVVMPASLGLPATMDRDGPFGGGLAAGTRIAGYTLVKMIGAGGMGVVYIAEQERPKRTVALKLIRAGILGLGSSGGVLKRFEAEADILARLHHAGIAQIYEAGSAPVELPPGEDRALSATHVAQHRQPYLAMELIDGPTITSYAEQHGLNTAARLGLLAQVCDAVEHAHQRGVIHRDLKPSNILVDTSGEGPQIKVLDFGVARVTDADLRVTTMQTRIGQLIGTLPYMSPEQVAGDPEAVDTRSDVYALGVVLYQLLTGKLPHDISSCSIPEAARIIRDETPQPPSRLGGTSRITSALRGDIDTIAARALEKEKARRYQSARDLGDDLRRHLAGEPIAAKRDSVGYVLQKKLRRYRALATAGLLIVLLAIAFGVVSGVQASRNRRLARDVQVKLMVSNVERARLMTAAGDLLESEGALWRERLANPDAAGPLWALWELYLKFPSVRAIPSLGKPAAALASHPRAGFAAIAIRKGEVEVWTIDLKQRVRELETGGREPTAVAFSPNGKLLGATSMDGHARVWNVTDWRMVADIPPGTGCKHLYGLAFSPDGERFLTVGDDGPGREYMLGDGTESPKELHLLEGPNSRGFGAAYSPDGNWIAIGGQLRGVFVYEAQTGRLATQLAIPRETVGSLMFTEDCGTLLATATRGLVRAWSTDSWKQSAEIRTDDPWVRGAIVWGAWPKVVLGGDQSVEVWDMDAGKRLERIVARPSGSLLVAGGPTEGDVLIAGMGATVRVIELQREPCLQTTLGISRSLAGVLAYDDAGDRLVGGDFGGLIAIAPRAAAGAPFKLQLPAAGLRDLIMNHDRTQLLSATSDGFVRVLDAATLEQLREWRVGQGMLSGLALRATGDEMAVCGKSGWVNRVSLADGRIMEQCVGHGGDGRGIAYSPDGRLLASVGAGPGLIVRDVRSGSIRFQGGEEGALGAVAFSPDGTVLATADAFSAITFYETSGFTKTHTLLGHSGEIGTIAFRPDGTLIASGSTDGTIRLWDVATGGGCVTLPYPGGRVFKLLWILGGRQLAACGEDGRVYTVDMRRHAALSAGNLPYVIGRSGSDLLSLPDRGRWERWADQTLAEERRTSTSPAAQ